MLQILVVEDEQSISNLIKINLTKAGYACDCAYDGLAAVVMLDKKPYDLVLLDITMPGRSGLEVLEEMLSLVPNIRVIMCSAVGQEMMIQKALTIGAADFIVKPFKADEFSRIVNRCLEQ